jgi:hypothetical protein
MSSAPSQARDVAKELRACDLCGKQKRHVRANRASQTLVCPACYVRWRQRWRPCFRCGEVGLPALRTDDGCVCKRCYRTEILVAQCARCLRHRPVFRRAGVSAICEACSDRYYSARNACSHCKRTMLIKGMPGGAPICGACYRSLLQPRRRCTVCARDWMVSIRLGNDGGICSKCYFAVTVRGPCGRCGTLKRILRSTKGPVCLRCFRAGTLTLAPLAGDRSTPPENSPAEP